MPSAKKTAYQNKTTNKKKQSFLSRLIPTTRKAKMITLVAAFAVIGGGFMVYRSFAATLPTLIAKPGSYLFGVPDLGRLVIETTDNVGGKNGATVFQLRQGGIADAMAYPQAGANIAQVCMEVRSIGAPTTVSIQYALGYNSSTYISTNRTANSGYGLACTNEFVLNPNTHIRARLKNNTTTAVNLASIHFRYRNNTPAPAPNPSPAPTPSTKAPAPTPAPAPAPTPPPTK